MRPSTQAYGVSHGCKWQARTLCRCPPRGASLRHRPWLACTRSVAVCTFMPSQTGVAQAGCRGVRRGRRLGGRRSCQVRPRKLPAHLAGRLQRHSCMRLPMRPRMPPECRTTCAVWCRSSGGWCWCRHDAVCCLRGPWVGRHPPASGRALCLPCRCGTCPVLWAVVGGCTAWAPGPQGEA